MATTVETTSKQTDQSENEEKSQPEKEGNDPQLPPMMESSYQFEEIPIEQIQAPDSPLRMSKKELEYLKDSIRDVGLLEPIIVAKSGKLFRVLAGRNRLEACRELECTRIPASVVTFEGDEIREKLVVLDENLCREDLTELEFAEALAQKKDLYQQLYPETAHGKNAKGKDPLNGSQPRRPSFLDDMEIKTGKGRSTLGESVHIGEKLDKNVKKQLRGTALANRKKDLLSLSRMEHEEQKKVAKVLTKNPDLPLTKAKKEANINTSSKKKKKSLYKDNPDGCLDFLKKIKDYVNKCFERCEESEIEDFLTCEIDEVEQRLTIQLRVSDEKTSE